jgi:hypothetical protein
MIKFRDTQADGFPMSRQATKTDLVDMCRALGTAAGDAWPLSQVRDAIRGKLPAAELDTSRQATKKDLLGIALALGCDVTSRPKNMPTEVLRAWIRTMLIQRGQGSPVFHAGELVVVPNGQRAVVIEQGARVEVRLLVGNGPLEHYWPGELKGTGERA